MNAVVLCMGKSSPSQSALDKIVFPIIGLLWFSIPINTLLFSTCHIMHYQEYFDMELKHCSNLIPQMEE
jgi:hypothetical protein